MNTDINNVTVYLSGAEINRTYQVKLDKGINELRFNNISASTDSRSIQFEMEQDVDLLSITMERDYLKNQEGSPRIESVRDSIELLEYKSQQIQDEISALQTEKEVLSTNQDIKGNNVSISVEQIQPTARFYRERTLAINTSISKKERNRKKINRQTSRLRQQLEAYNYKENARNNVIVVLVESTAPIQLEGDLKYNVSQAGWAPNYDLIAEDISGGIELKYKAKVYNNTGNNWSSIGIQLSTGDPNLSASVPNLDPWQLKYQELNTGYKSKGKRNYQVPQAQSRQAPNKQVARSDQGLTGQGRIQNTHTGNISGVNDTPEMRKIEVSELSTEFDIDRKYSIPSDAKPYIVEITEYDLEASFAHIAVPKLDKDAFLLAKITGWEQLDLVPGPSNIYFNQTYVGESYINTRNVEDTLGLSFGRDDKILVTRKRVEDFSS
ncbi:MAG: mucoidy inhibitor MuiA family protein, partial [Bacteroidota bacterium]